MAVHNSYPPQGFIVGDAEMQVFLRRGQHLRAVAIATALRQAGRWLIRAPRRLARRFLTLHSAPLWRAPGSGRCLNG